MSKHAVKGEFTRRHRWTAAVLAALIGFPVLLVQSSAVQVAHAAGTDNLRLNVVAARDSSLRPARGDDPCAPDRGMKLLTPTPAGCVLNRNDTGASFANNTTTINDSHAVATDIGATVSGIGGIPANAKIVSVDPGTSVEISAATTSAGSGTLHLARSNPAAFTYKWIINLDNTGNSHQASTAKGIDAGDNTINGSDVCRPLSASNPDGNAAFPTGCDWPSVHTADASPVITQGTSTDWNLATSLGDATHRLPDGKYLVSVSADGFEIGGAHFQVPFPVANASDPGIITVGLNPYPIPLGTIQVQVFDDNAPADGTFDATTEHGLQGWNATVNDILGQVSTDWYGNPICTEYERMVPAGLLAISPSGTPDTMSPDLALMTYTGAGAAAAMAYYGQGNTEYVFSYADYTSWGIALDGGDPVRVPGTGGKCLSDADGIIRVPNMGTNRYSVTVAPPAGTPHPEHWIETTTLEGGHDSDFWLMANDSGLDSEMVQAGEPVPWAQFGFVDLENKDQHGVSQPWPITANGSATGEIKGTVLAAEPYVPGQGGLPGQGGANGQSGIRYPRKLDRVIVGLNDFDNGDLLGFATQNDDNGTFDIKHVKDGTYLLSVWDIDQDYAFDVFNVTVVGGKLIDLGDVPIIGWFTRVTGKVFVDSNANGKLDPGEQGVPNFGVTIKNRTNDLLVSGQNAATTDFWGNYKIQEGYPAGSFLIQEFFNTRYKTTGVTYQADNDPQAHTVLTAAVDLSLLPIIGQDGHVDIGVLPYDTAVDPCDDTCQGGIVATVVYDATRNELNPRKAATEDYEPGIPNIPVKIDAPVPCAGPADNCDVTRHIHLNPDGSAAVGPALSVGDDPTVNDVAPGNLDASATYVTEEWHRPGDCIPRDSEGRPVVQDALPNTHTARQAYDCVEATEMGTTFGFADGDTAPYDTDGQQVDGNYGFVTWHPGDYLVSVDIPNDPIYNRPLYKVRTAEPINVFTGDEYVPQGANLNGSIFQDYLKANRGDPTVPQMSDQGHGLREPASSSSPYPDAECVGPLVTVYANDPVNHPDTYNPDLHNVGGSPYEGVQVHDCSMKLIHVEAGQSVAPNFSLWTDVPIPSKFWGYVTDDVSVSTDRRSTALGEVQGVADVPVGLYDWTNRLLTTVDTDYNGLFEVLMPSTNSYNCPVPAGPCSGMYRFVGNDPGQPQRPNLNYKPIYRTIAANFQAWPGIFTFADTAPTRATVQIEGPASQFAAAIVCKAADTEPQLFRVDYPYLPNPTNFNASNSETTGTIEIYGQGFGTAKGKVTLTNESNVTTTLTGASLPTWTDTHVTMQVTLSSLAGGAYQLHVVQDASAGALSTVNGLTVHVLKSPYTTVAATRNVHSHASSGSPNLTIPTLWFLLGDSYSSADVGTHITGSGIPANTIITKVVDATHAVMSANSSVNDTNVAVLQPTRPLAPESFETRFPDVMHVAPLSTLHRIDPSLTNSVALQAPNAPYTNWSETTRPTMFTPTDPNLFYYPGPIQKAINAGWNRYLNVNPLAEAIIDAIDGPNDPARPLAEQAAGQKNRHPLVITYPRLDNNPITGAPATDGVTGQPSYDPDDPTLAFNANGAYYESPVMFYPVKVQGAGPGGILPDTSGGVTGPIPVFGSVVDGQYYNAATNKPEGNTSDLPDNTVEVPFDPSLFSEPYAAYWENFVVFQLGSGATPTDPVIPTAPSPLPSWYGYGWDGQQAPTEGEVFYVLAHNGDYTSSYKAAIDGMTITGGDQKGFPGNRNEVGGGRIANAPGETGTAPDENFVLDIQGGAIMANAFARFLQITNNTVIANSGASGAIRIGTPQLGTDTEDGNPETDPATGETFPTFDQQNTDLRLAYNRITANGGTSLGGALAIFNGSERYHVDHNEFCGNFSAEYGGAISHFGLSKNGTIDHNKIYLNESVDEGAGIMIAGEPHLDPATATPIPNALSNGSGPVSIHDNYIASNLAGDDGGGIRFLQSGTWQADVYNNMITNNVSTHEGGGVALDDATNVRIFNNTIAKNVTTATAVTSTGAPAPAGLSTSDNSTELMNCNSTTGRTATLGHRTNNSFVFTLQSNAPPTSNFTVADIGATLVATGIPAGAMIVAIGAGGRSATLSMRASGTANLATFRVVNACSGMPPQAAGASSFSNPLLFNDIFDDNRAGNWQTTGTVPGVHGIGLVTGEAVRHWDLGVADNPSLLLSPTSSIINQDVLIYPITTSATNQVHNETQVVPADYPNYAKFAGPFDIGVSVSPWRVNPRFRPTSIVGVSLPANAMGDYHLASNTSPAYNTAASSKNVVPFGLVNAPSTDIDGDARPALNGFDKGADEIRQRTADLSISKSHSPATVAEGEQVTYTINVTNNGPDDVAGALVTDGFPGTLSNISWTCSITSAGFGPGTNSCNGSGTGNITNQPVNLRLGAVAQFVATATVTAAAGPTPVGKPNLGVLDNFDRANATTLGSNWAQVTISGTGAFQVSGNQASCSACGLGGTAYYNNPTTGYGAKQAAGFTFVNTPTTDSSLMLKASGGAANAPASRLRVRYHPTANTTINNTATVSAPAGVIDASGNNSSADSLTVLHGQLIVETATGVGFTQRGSTMTIAFAPGDQFTAQVSVLTTPANTVAVDVWRTSGPADRYVGRQTFVLGTTFTGTGRIGIDAQAGSNLVIDDFRGGTVS